MESKVKKGFRRRYIFIVLLLVVVTTLAIDYNRISNYDIKPQRPESNILLEQDDIYRDLKQGKEIDWSRLNGTLEYIDGQYDCSDFRMVNLIRILYEFGNQIPEATRQKIEKTLFGFRYWWDEPGENSMCYWSENHQILFASAEYLIGQLYPETVFQASGLTGKEHMAKARIRTLDWLEMRWNYGFIEFYSGVYYKEDIGPMINLIDYANDKEIVEKTKIIMDLLLYDISSQSIGDVFVSASGRAYTGNRKGGSGLDVGGLTRYYWGNGDSIRSGMVHGLMYTNTYSPPPIFKEIANDTNNVVIRQHNGLDVIELKGEGYFGDDNRSMMMQLGMESFTNPEIVRNTLSWMRQSRMFNNAFVKDFKTLDVTLLRWLHLEPAIIRIINPQSNGVAIQKGNTYTYKTKDYTLYSVQKYHPGTYGDQHHVSGMNIGNSFSIFHTHPALEKGVENQSPNYWVGYGHLPHVAQDGNVSLSIYNIPEKKGMMERALLDYTHAYFPTEKFDTVRIIENMAMGKKDNTYCAFIAANPLSLRENTTDNILQDGKQVFWITEAGSKGEDKSFDAFCSRVLKNKVTFDSESMKLNYESRGKRYELVFDGDFRLNEQLVSINYDRYDSPYIQAKRKAETLTIKFNGQSLFLDFDNMIREIGSSH